MDSNVINFIKIPNIIFWDKKEKNILQQCNFDYKVTLIMDFIYNNISMRNTIIFSLNFMVKECGFIPNTHKDKVNDHFKKILQLLQDKSLLIYKDKLINIKSKDVIKVKVNKDFYKNGFVEILDSEKNIIINQAIDTQVDNKKLYTYFCYIKTRMFKRNKQQGQRMMSGGLSNDITWVTFETITKDTGISSCTIQKYNDLLVRLKLILYDRLNNWYWKGDPNKVIHSGMNVYCLNEFDDMKACKLELKEAIKYLTNDPKNKDKIFTDSKEYLHGSKSYAGKLSAIARKIKNSTATNEDLIEKKELKENRDNGNNEKWYIKNLFNNKQKKLLSDIFYNSGDDNRFNNYSEIEKNLKLTDGYGNLLVDWDAYKWIMINYSDTPIEEVKGYIKKHRIQIDGWGTKGEAI